MSGKKKKKGAQAQKRQERRFFPRSAYSPWLVYLTGGLGAALLGAGAWGYLYGHAFDASTSLRALPQYLVAAGAVLSGMAIWFGSSSEAPLRVGAPGIGIERGEVRRVPWWAVERIAWDASASALTIAGKDESGVSTSFNVPVKSHPEAVAAIVSEAEARIPNSIELADDVRAALPSASPHAGLLLDLEALQVVGKRCAASGEIISYEPDGRVCTRCERVYAKGSVPKKCACGANLSSLRDKAAEEGDDASESVSASTEA